MWRVKTRFFQFFVFVSWIGTLNANGIHFQKNFTRLTRFAPPPTNMTWRCHRRSVQVWDLCSYVRFFAPGAYMVKRVCLQTEQYLLTNFKDHPHLGSSSPCLASHQFSSQNQSCYCVLWSDWGCAWLLRPCPPPARSTPGEASRKLVLEKKSCSSMYRMVHPRLY